MRTANGVRVSHTRSGDVIPVDKKRSFKKFCSLVWTMSNTNLHYIDFCEVFGDQLKVMFKPVAIEVIDVEARLSGDPVHELSSGARSDSGATVRDSSVMGGLIDDCYRHLARRGG